MGTRSENPRRRAASYGAVLLSVTVVVLLLFAPPASAEETTVGTSAEAWYTVLPTCTAAPALCVAPGTVPSPPPTEIPPDVVPPDTLPPGVPPLPVLPPAGTLHVARVAGTEVARTYLKLDLETLPADATITGGTLTLPIATDQTAGTLSPELAHIQACFMVAGFTPGALGSIEEPPVPDCSTSSTATLITLAEGSSFVVDLAPFAGRWAEGEANEGIALMPALVDAPEGPLPPGTLPVPLPSTETWHVAFNGRDSDAAAKISASISYVLPGFEPLPPLPAPPAVVPGVPGYSIPGAPPPAFATPPALPSRQVPTVLVATRGFEYAAIFVLPLVALAIGSAVSYSLTREIET